MMRSKMLDRAEARGEARGEKRGEMRGVERGRAEGRSDALNMVRLFIAYNDVSRVAETLGEEESVVKESLVEAGLIQE